MFNSAMNLMRHMVLIVVFIALGCIPATGQAQLADTLIDAFYSGAHPSMSGFYGQIDRCDEFRVNPEVCLGSNDTLLALPTGSYVTVGFIDNIIIDAPNQPDLYVDEIGPSDEFAEIYISNDLGQTFTFFGIINGGTTNALDLADIGYDDCVNAVKVIGLDNNGCIPGFDVVRIYGISGASVDPVPPTHTPDTLCTDTGPFDLTRLEASNLRGQWAGPHVTDNVFQTNGVTGSYDLEYWITEDFPGCDQDTATIVLHVWSCDCAGTPDGRALIDNCGECFEPDDPRFDFTCIPKEVYVPNVFSPNSDGVNDAFSIFLANDISATIQQSVIYDRWGNTVSQSNDTEFYQQQDIWDGRINGSDAPPGVYIYHIRLTFVDDVVLDYHGDVTLLR